MKHLSDAIRENTTISTLRLNGNYIGSNPDYMKYLTHGIRDNKIITVLDLWKNDIGSKPQNLKYIEEMKKKGIQIIY